jgi:hypothetical protein
MIKNERLHAQVVHSALKKLRQEDGKFKVSLGNIVRPCLKKKGREREKEREKQEEQKKTFVLQNNLVLSANIGSNFNLSCPCISNFGS